MASLEKISVNLPIVVEGKYDKIKLLSLVDGIVICSDGFRIFKDREKLAMLRRLGRDGGIILLTDSDVAGFKLRNYIKQCLKDINVINIYIPQIYGKEKRKLAPSKQGLLGVEGMNIDLLRKLFYDAGITGVSHEPLVPLANPIVHSDFYSAGYIGQENSAAKRQELLKALELPSYISTKALLQIINRVMTLDEFEQFNSQQNHSN